MLQRMKNIVFNLIKFWYFFNYYLYIVITEFWMSKDLGPNQAKWPLSLLHIFLLYNKLLHKFSGYARLSNVEFRYTGQEGWVERGDARTSLAFADAGTVNPIKPSYVKHCSFHKSFAPAITVHGTNNLPIEWNIMADSVWFGMYGAIKQNTWMLKKTTFCNLHSHQAVFWKYSKTRL